MIAGYDFSLTLVLTGMYLVKTEASELLTLLFSMKDEPENTPIPTKAAKAMCWNLVDAGLGFEKLHSVASQAREIGPSNHLESVLRQTFLSKISGFPADEVDQVIFVMFSSSFNFFVLFV